MASRICLTRSCAFSRSYEAFACSSRERVYMSMFAWTSALCRQASAFSRISSVDLLRAPVASSVTSTESPVIRL